jgi:UDP-glucose 4-epimerase
MLKALMGDQMRVIVTGGLGYIGSHICIELINHGYEVVIIDNLSNSMSKALDSIQEITDIRPIFYQLDIRDDKAITALFHEIMPEAVIHCAALKDVVESFSKADEYNAVNVQGTFNLLEACKSAGVNKFIFSSSAAIYGRPKNLPLLETSKIDPISPYGQSKFSGELAIHKGSNEVTKIQSAILRCSNPVGGHPSGHLGESPLCEPTNLMPTICRAAKTGVALKVFGSDYHTEDGTAKRDYVHVVDVASAHIAALQYLGRTELEVTTLNICVGRGCSVLEVVNCFERVNGLSITCNFMERRDGDAAESYGDNSQAKSSLNWNPSFSMEEMCIHSWNWFQRDI